MIDRYEFPSPVSLAGGFRCLLTPSEENEWDEFAVETAAWKRFRAAVEAIEAAQLSGGFTPAEAVAAVQEKGDAHVQMYRVGKAWYADLLRRKAEGKGTP